MQLSVGAFLPLFRVLVSRVKELKVSYHEVAALAALPTTILAEPADLLCRMELSFWKTGLRDVVEGALIRT